MPSPASTHFHCERNPTQSRPSDMWFLFTQSANQQSLPTLSSGIIILTLFFRVFTSNSQNSHVLFYKSLDMQLCLCDAPTLCYRTFVVAWDWKVSHDPFFHTVLHCSHVASQSQPTLEQSRFFFVLFFIQVKFSDVWMLCLVVSSVFQPQMSALPNMYY